MLTSQFVSSIVFTQSQEDHLGKNVTLGKVLDERADLKALGISEEKAKSARLQFYDHLQSLPDVLHVNVFAGDRKVIWSSNPAFAGSYDTDNEELERTFSSGAMVATDYLNQQHHNEADHKHEQEFVVNPESFFVENYIPLLDAAGKVDAVVEMYKEPKTLQDTINRGHLLVWSSTGLGVVFLYLAMYWIIRSADKSVEEQQRLLIESESLCLLGEMSAAVAHGIRKPLTTIRTSAEMAHEMDPGSVSGKYAVDIMSQTDRLDKWIRELLVSSHPVERDKQLIDMAGVIEECLVYMSGQLENNKISYEFIRPSSKVPSVGGNRVLITQALVSVVSNAIEAMPQGGKLELFLNYSERERRVEIIVSDTGVGLSQQEIQEIFKPFHTTKRNGIGLGLAQVRSVMNRFGAAFHMSSEKNIGTRVTLSFNAMEGI